MKKWWRHTESYPRLQKFKRDLKRPKPELIKPNKLKIKMSCPGTYDENAQASELRSYVVYTYAAPLFVNKTNVARKLHPHTLNAARKLLKMAGMGRVRRRS